MKEGYRKFKKRPASLINRSLVLFSLMIITLNTSVFAQGQTLTGTITSEEDGEPIPGATVLLQGTSQGTITNLDGEYRLQIQDTENPVLVVSFVGYQTQEIPVAGQSTIDVALGVDVQSLEEVVVIGYGTQKKTLTTGANLQVKGDEIQRLSTTNALQGLQGQTPGVQISSTSGQPGAGLNVRIRGLGTIGNSSPLYIVDGVQTGDISYLNPADIESIDILKDAASAAIYGSQAANGVVLVTTKKGSAGKTRVTFDSYYGLQNVPNQIDMLNAREYATIMNEQAINSGKAPYFTNQQIAALDSGTNWMDEMFEENAKTQNYVLGLTGGSDNSVYSASLGYTSQEGIVGGKDLSFYERYNFRINSEHDLFNGLLTFGENLTFTFTNDNGIGVGNQYNNSLRGAFNTSPFVPMYDSEGNFWDNSNSWWYTGESNPYADMYYNNQNDNNDQKLLGNIYLEVEPIENLTFRTSLGVDYYAYEDRSYRPEYSLSIYSFNNNTEVNQTLGKGRTMMWDNLLKYSFELPSEHYFDVMVGSSLFDYQGVFVSGSNINLIIQDLDFAYLSNATNTTGASMSLSGGPEDPDRRLSYFGRLSYNFRETYLLNATFRADGSSRFAQGNQWGYFPSISAGWVMSNESFMEGLNWLNFFKVRASWGQVGNQNIPAFQYLAPIRVENTNYIFGPDEGILTPGAYPYRLAEEELKWETSEQTNIGFDARVLEGRLNVTFDWYKKTTWDWLIAAPILATAGALPPYINGGNVENKGVELALSYADNVGDFNYSVSVNGAYNDNVVEEIPTEDGIVHGATNQLYNNAPEFYRAQSGFPIGYFWGYETDGIFQTEAEVASYTSAEGGLIQPNAQPGDLRYVDQNNDGVINESDRTMIGDPNPDFTFGFNVSADYKGFDFSVLATGVAGNQIVQSYRGITSRYSNYTTAILDRWHGPGTSNTVPRVTETSNNWINFSDVYIQDGDFLRISNVTLGYDFSGLIDKENIGKVRLYFSALNLFTFTNYNGMDPEIGYGIDEDGDQVGTYSSGIDLGYYPRPRTFMVGLNLQF